VGKGSTTLGRRTTLARRGSRSTARASAARSPAHEWLPRSANPSGDENRLHVRPIAAARAFISPTKPWIVPPACSASARAASLPDGSSSPYSIVATRIRFPRRNIPTPEPR
jgi:hypothetical protein